jgi:TonB family protein
MTIRVPLRIMAASNFYGAGVQFMYSVRASCAGRFATLGRLSCALFAASMTANAQFAADTSGQQALELFNGKQFAAARDQATAGASAGSVVSMYVLGEIYSSGKGADRDYAEAASWFLKAADAGYPPAMNAMGSARETGYGVEQNLALAEGWYQRSAEKGDAVGMNNLGHMFEIGGGVPKDYAQAFQWYLKGAEAGASAAMVHVGLMYENGHAVNQSGQPAFQDFGEALKWYEKAAKAGDAAGMYRLALSYDIGKGTAPNRPLAMEWYRKAADAGSDAARARLGNQTSGSQASVGNPLPNLAGRGATGTDGVYRAGNGVSQPSLVSKVEPDYSETARKMRAEGVVVLQMVVQQDGTPRNLRVMRSLNYGLDQKAIEAVQKWRFNPGMKDGNAVAVAATVEVNFRLLKGGPLDFWYSGPMAFALETGVTMPLVGNGTMPKGVREISDESVVFEFTVDSSGSVKDIRSVHGSQSSSDLLSPYLAGWKFQPAVKDGQSVEATGRVRFVKGQGDDASKQPLLPPPLTGSNPPAPRRALQENAPRKALNLLAWYKFGSDGSDATGISRPFSLSGNTVFRDGSLYLNGVYEVSVEKAVANVPRLNYLHFTAALDFKAETFDVKKRVILYGGTAYRWWGLGWNNGFLELTLNNGSFRHLFESAELSQGAWHNVICSADLSAGVIRTVLDGKALEDVQLPQDFRLEVVGSQREGGDKQFTFANYGIGTTFQGYVNNLRIYGDSLSAAELHSLYQSIANRTPDPVRTVSSPGESTAGPDGAYHGGNGVSQPKLMHKVEPDYSKAARAAKLQGVVVLQVVVDANGKVMNPRVMKSLGLGLDEKAIGAVRKWKFAPGYKDGKPVAVAVTVEVNFRLI